MTVYYLAFNPQATRLGGYPGGGEKRFLIIMLLANYQHFLNNLIEKQAVSMMPVNHVQSRVCHIAVLADPSNTSNHFVEANGDQNKEIDR